ncbi:MAG: hypothetical protein JKY86_00495 [Gammaproteobacteria bacterium]|nr:hypothetical protein [Gammaproteobacteria bacterium]
MQNRKIVRQWLTLLIGIVFILNVQASYACAMMPDMEQEQTNCCCGPSHRMDDMPDHSDMVGMQENYSVLGETDHSAQGPECNDPQMGCCIVEVSVGINDPPGDDDAAVPHSKSVQQKSAQQQDSNSPAVAYYDLAESYDLHRFISRVERPESYPPYVTPSLYKSTERYRI